MVKPTDSRLSPFLCHKRGHFAQVRAERPNRSRVADRPSRPSRPAPDDRMGRRWLIE